MHSLKKSAARVTEQRYFVGRSISSIIVNTPYGHTNLSQPYSITSRGYKPHFTAFYSLFSLYSCHLSVLYIFRKSEAAIYPAIFTADLKNNVIYCF